MSLDQIELMEPVDTTNLLNRLHVIHHRSLVSYLAYAKPWTLRGDEAARETLDKIAADHRAAANRIATLILDSNGEVAAGEFPMTFTGYHDLSYEYLVGRVTAHQSQDIRAIQLCVDQMSRAPLAKALAEELLGAAKAHLESLEELRANPAGAR